MITLHPVRADSPPLRFGTAASKRWLYRGALACLLGLSSCASRPDTFTRMPAVQEGDASGSAQGITPQDSEALTQFLKQRTLPGPPVVSAENYDAVVRQTLEQGHPVLVLFFDPSDMESWPLQKKMLQMATEKELQGSCVVAIQTDDTHNQQEPAIRMLLQELEGSSVEALPAFVLIRPTGVQFSRDGSQNLLVALITIEPDTEMTSEELAKLIQELTKRPPSSFPSQPHPDPHGSPSFPIITPRKHWLQHVSISRQ